VLSRPKEHLSMSPEVGSIVLVIVLLSATAWSFYFNICLAKNRVSVWKRGSTYMFMRLLGAGRRASLFWMEELGYEESDAVILARYQGRAVRFTVVSFFVLGTIITNLIHQR
jgi:hypothetical protein